MWKQHIEAQRQRLLISGVARFEDIPCFSVSVRHWQNDSGYVGRDVSNMATQTSPTIGFKAGKRRFQELH